MGMLYLLTALVAAGCGEKNNPEPLGKNTSPLSEKVQQANQDPKAPVKSKQPQGINRATNTPAAHPLPSD